jgi:hypothetical protein
MAVAQAEVRNAVPNAENPHFRSQYADLEAVKAACLPFLNKHGISIVQSPVVQDGRIGVVTRLLHKSGQWMEGEFTMPGVKQDPQGYGSALTYARRYSLAAFAGVATGEDDDAEKAHEPKRGGSAANTTPPARTAPTSTPRPTALVDTVTEAEIRSLYDRAKQAGADAKRVPEVLATEFPYISDAVGAVHLLALKRADFSLAQTICETIKPAADAPAAASAGVFHEVWPEQEFTDKTVKTVASVAAINDPVKSEKTGKYGPFKIDLKNAEDGVLFTVETFHKTLAETCKAAGDTLREIAFDEVVNGRFTNRYLVGVR